MNKNEEIEYIEYLRNKIEEHVVSVKRLIDSKMYLAAEEKIRYISAMEEKLVENRLRIKEL